MVEQSSCLDFDNIFSCSKGKLPFFSFTVLIRSSKKTNIIYCA